MKTVQEIIEEALLRLNNPDYDFHQAVIYRLAVELAEPYDTNTITEE